VQGIDIFQNKDLKVGPEALWMTPFHLEWFLFVLAQADRSLEYQTLTNLRGL